MGRDETVCARPHEFVESVEPSDVQSLFRLNQQIARGVFFVPVLPKQSVQKSQIFLFRESLLLPILRAIRRVSPMRSVLVYVAVPLVILGAGVIRALAGLCNFGYWSYACDLVHSSSPPGIACL
jgi:hypothetical protein